MVSRRNFFSITIMMAVLFFMFQFSQVLKSQGSNYDVNEFAEKDRPFRVEHTETMQTRENTINDENEDYIVFVGDKNSESCKTVKEWSTYAKKGFVLCETFDSFDLTGKLPGLIFVDMDSFDYNRYTEEVMKLAENKELVFVFCGAPDMEQMKKLPDLAELFGVDISGTKIEENFAETVGIHIFSGFLLGGEVYYQPPKRMEEEKAEQIQDLDYGMQWYITGRGTKTYMVGLMDDEDMDKELYPAIIWRHSYGKSQVYVVTGGYIEGAGGFGVIDGIIYESFDYFVYPVVNARNTVLADFPGFAAENEEKMMELYARSQSAVQKDILWPNLMSLARKDNLTLTCAANIQYDYSDNIWPESTDLDFYFQQFKESGGELGWSMKESRASGVLEKMTSDLSFFEVIDRPYKFAAVYADQLSDELIENIGKGTKAEDVVTVVVPHTENLSYLSFGSDHVTVQCSTADALEYAYSGDFATRGLISSLGYTNVVMDIHNVIWPETPADQWENYIEEASSYITSFWNMYDGFERTTLSESDIRVRNFLNLSYSDKRDGSTIQVRVEDADESWFVLRTHDEKIGSTEGCTYEELEENVYLLHISGDGCTITLKDSENNFKY